VFLGINRLPHPAVLRAVCEVLGLSAPGGWIWSAGALVAYLLRIDGSDRAVKLVTPIVALVAFISERPAKVVFARQRPFRHLVKMMLLGVKPRARSLVHPGGCRGQHSLRRKPGDHRSSATRACRLDGQKELCTGR
jgi:hypothetical protein